MLGGWTWLLNGDLVRGAREDGMLARLGKGRDGWALATPGIAPMISRGRGLSDGGADKANNDAVMSGLVPAIHAGPLAAGLFV